MPPFTASSKRQMRAHSPSAGPSPRRDHRSREARVLSGRFMPTVGEIEAVALLVEFLVVGYRDPAAARRGNARRDAALYQSGAKPVAVIAAFTEQIAGWRQCGEDHRSALVIALWPSLSSITTGRPWPSHTPCSLEFMPPLVRPIQRGEPRSKQAGRSSVCLEMRGVFHQPVRLARFGHQCREDALQNTKAASAHKAVAERLVSAIPVRRSVVASTDGT